MGTKCKGGGGDKHGMGGGDKHGMGGGDKHGMGRRWGWKCANRTLGVSHDGSVE